LHESVLTLRWGWGVFGAHIKHTLVGQKAQAREELHKSVLTLSVAVADLYLCLSVVRVGTVLFHVS